MLLAIIGGCTSNPALCPHLPHLPTIHLASANDQPNGKSISTDADVSDVHADVEDAAPLSADEEARVAEEAKRAGEDQTVGDLLKGKKGSITRAKLPKGSPSWDEIRDLTLSDVEKRARANARGFKTIAKLLKDTRFNK